MNIKSLLVLKIVSIVSKYKRWIKNCLAFLPSEFLIDNQIINATKIDRTHVRAALLLAKVLVVFSGVFIKKQSLSNDFMS